MHQPPEWKYDLPYRWTLDIDGQKYDILYGGHIANVTADTDSYSIEFDGRSEGSTLELRLSGALIDSAQNNHDIPFTVLVNGQPSVNVTQGVVPSTGDRMVCIPLSNFGPWSKIEIIGTSIVPEFDMLVVIVSAMAAAIVASIGFKQRMPKL